MYVYILLQAHVSICKFFARIFQDISFFPHKCDGHVLTNKRSLYMCLLCLLLFYYNNLYI